jgi:hypothetical protein
VEVKRALELAFVQALGREQPAATEGDSLRKCLADALGLIGEGSAANASSASDCTPRARRMRKPAALAAACSSSAVFPIPGSPTNTSAALVPLRAAASRASIRRCSLPRPTSTLEA